ncbi:cyclin-T1 isoform X3 [Rissa tridactyla]|nr:cyclin-T1 isoform X3 [Rissa tridactyla]
MISRNNSSDMNIAGLMSMSTSSTAGAGPSLPATADSPSDQSAADMSQSEHWHPPAKLEIGQSHRTNESSSASEHPLQQDGAGYQKQSGKNAPAAKVSLKEYRAKHAEELAAQKRQLENMEANVRSQYAYAAQNLLVQQQREREVQQDSNPSPIILKIPIGGSENLERPPAPEKSDKASALKLRIPMAGGGGERPPLSKQEEIKMRIKVPTAAERLGSSDESGAKNREYKEKHKGHSSNHHHHHNHHSHKHLHAQLGAGPSNVATKRPGDSKHSIQPSAVPHKSYAPPASSRKRPLLEEAPAMATAGAHEHQPKVSKVSKGPAMPFPYPHLPGAAHLPGHSSDAGNLPLPQATKARATHGKSDKGPTGANGHNANQASDYQDTVNMLHSLLSAQGMQPTQPPAFDYHSYGELLNPRASTSSRAPANTDKPRPPPLPSEPPPPLPPLPK